MFEPIHHYHFRYKVASYGANVGFWAHHVIWVDEQHFGRFRVEADVEP
jgi:hypothetical protein